MTSDMPSLMKPARGLGKNGIPRLVFVVVRMDNWVRPGGAQKQEEEEEVEQHRKSSSNNARGGKAGSFEGQQREVQALWRDRPQDLALPASGLQCVWWKRARAGNCGNNVTALACVGRSSRSDHSGTDVTSEYAEDFMCTVAHGQSDDDILCGLELGIQATQGAGGGFKDRSLKDPWKRYPVPFPGPFSMMTSSRYPL